MADIEPVGRHRIVETVIASGRIQPEVEVKVSAEVSGQLIELPVQATGWKPANCWRASTPTSMRAA